MSAPTSSAAPPAPTAVVATPTRRQPAAQADIPCDCCGRPCNARRAKVINPAEPRRHHVILRFCNIRCLRRLKAFCTVNRFDPDTGYQHLLNVIEHFGLSLGSGRNGAAYKVPRGYKSARFPGRMVEFIDSVLMRLVQDNVPVTLSSNHFEGLRVALLGFELVMNHTGFNVATRVPLALPRSFFNDDEEDEDDVDVEAAARRRRRASNRLPAPRVPVPLRAPGPAAPAVAAPAPAAPPAAPPAVAPPAAIVAAPLSLVSPFAPIQEAPAAAATTKRLLDVPDDKDGFLEITSDDDDDSDDDDSDEPELKRSRVSVALGGPPPVTAVAVANNADDRLVDVEQRRTAPVAAPMPITLDPLPQLQGYQDLLLGGPTFDDLLVEHLGLDALDELMPDDALGSLFAL